MCLSTRPLRASSSGRVRCVLIVDCVLEGVGVRAGGEEGGGPERQGAKSGVWRVGEGMGCGAWGRRGVLILSAAGEVVWGIQAGKGKGWGGLRAVGFEGC